MVGKGSPGAEPFIDLDTMLNLTAAAEVDGVKFDGVDLFLFAPHVDIDASDDDLKRLADKVRSRNLVIGSVVASADIPAATQRFTPKWIVRYLVQNTLGRQWMATYPQSPLKGQMKYYIEPAEQTPEVQEQLKAITPTSLDP